VTAEARSPAGPDPASWTDHESGNPQVDELVSVLAVRRVDELTCTGTSAGRPEGRIFGGQLLAQCAVAASLTVAAPATLHSLHAYFVRAGRPREEIRFVVDPLRDGRSYGTRRVDAVQDGRVIATAMLSFQRAETGPDHQDPAPARPDPAGLAGRVPFGTTRDGPGRAGALDLRACPPDDGDRAASSVWLRVDGRLPDDPLLHRALLVYLSDLTVVHGAFRAHGLARRDLRTASLDHCLWLHRPGRVDDWVLYDSRSPSASGGRAVGQGRIFAASGELLATAAQEMSVRVRR
jgi:acyl-CoA thioesterase II